MLVDWLGGTGSGASTLAFQVAQATAAEGEMIVVMDPERRFYPPAVVKLGINPDQLIIVNPQSDTDAIWASDQTARCRGVAAVLWRCKKLDSRHQRRLQLACESSGSLTFLLRPLTLQKEPSWAHVRMLIRASEKLGTSLPNQLHIELLKGSSGATGIYLEMDYEPIKMRSGDDKQPRSGLL